MVRDVHKPSLVRLFAGLLAFSMSLGAAQAGALRDWNQALPKARAERAIEGVLREVGRQARLGKKPIVVVDIDDTVVDGRARLAVAAARAGLKVSSRTRHGEDLYATVAPDARDAKRKLFNAHYFEDAKLASLDRPQAGAISFIKRVRALGGRVVYSTGRWESTRATTEPWLKKLGFPLDASRDLRLNPDPSKKAVEHKQIVGRALRGEGQVVAYFDNEIQSVRDYRRLFPRAKGFRLRTFSFQRDQANVPQSVSVIRNFSR